MAASSWTQLFPPKPKFTEKDVPDLHGKVYIVTGANTGVGKELSRLLYSRNAKVYVAARSQAKAEGAIADISKAHPESKGSLVFLKIDLNDLTTIKTTVEEFLSKEKRLDVLFNNAGVMIGGDDERAAGTAQGYELHLGVNDIAPFLLTKLLMPTLVATAKSSPPNTVRVIWVSSSGTELMGYKNTGLDINNLDYHEPKDGMTKYALSKVGNWLHGAEFAKRYPGSGVISVPLNPGNLGTELARNQTIFIKIIAWLICHPPINGAYTEFFAGLSPEITLQRSGCWVVPFGRIYEIRKDLQNATKTEAEGGNGTAAKFWDWTEEQVKPYL